MNRTEFISVLKKLNPALAVSTPSGQSPALECFLFDGKAVTAFDGVVAIQANCDVPINGGLRGKPLLGYLQSRSGETIKVSETENGIVVQVGDKASKGNTAIPLIPKSDFAFEFPTEEGTTIPIDEDFTDYVDRARICMGRTMPANWSTGITLVPDEKPVMYSTDNLTAIRVALPANIQCNVPVIVLSPKFCDCLVSLAENDKPVSLVIHDDWALVNFTSGTKLWSVSNRESDADRYKGTFGCFSEAETKEALMPIPKGLDEALGSAEVFLPFCALPHSEFKIDGIKLTIKTTTPNGNADDDLDIEERPSVNIKANPKNIRRILKDAEKIGFLSNKIVLRGPGFSYMCGVIEES